MITGYIRYSTSTQDDVQQKFALEEYAQHHHLNIDEYVLDEGISGGVSYKRRRLYNLVQKMHAGDTLIVTEISRIGRSMGDVNMFVTQELKPRKLRLIVVKMGLDLDCANLKAVDEMIIFAFSFSAQCEKEMIVQRTQSALDARKELIKQDGGFFSKSGRWCQKLGRPKGYEFAPTQLHSARIQADKAAEWRAKSPLMKRIKRNLGKGWSRREIVEDAREMYEIDPVGFGTRDGKPLTEALLSKYMKYLQFPRV